MGVLETGEDGSSFVFFPVSDEHGALTWRHHGCGCVGDRKGRGVERMVCMYREPLALYGETYKKEQEHVGGGERTDTASRYEQSDTNPLIDQEPYCDTW